MLWHLVVALTIVTLKGPKGNSVDVKAPDQLEGFNTLKVGDEVTATYTVDLTYFESLLVKVGRPAKED